MLRPLLRIIKVEGWALLVRSSVVSLTFIGVGVTKLLNSQAHDKNC